MGMEEDNLRLQELTSSAKRRTVKTISGSDRCSIGMKESNLSPPVLAKNKGTVVFRLVPLQGEVSGSVPDFMPILHWSLFLQ